MYYQISIARVEIKRNDKSRHSRGAKLVRLPYWKFAENEQIASRASWSVSAGWIPIGNHFPACFLKVSTHQKQKLTHNVSGCLDAFNNKESKRVRESTNMLWEQKIASILEILWSRLTGRSMYFDDVAPSIKSTDSKRNLFFFFSCLNQDLMENFTCILSSGRDGVFILPYIAYIYQTFTLQAGDKDKSCKGRMSPAGWPSAH